MDRTAIAAIIIGFGTAIAAMVMPLRYPNAPKWTLDLAWYGGLLLIVIGCFVLLTEHTLGDLILTLVAAVAWAFGYAIALLRLPVFWVIVAFGGGIALRHWLPLLWGKLPGKKRGPQVAEWLTPVQAAERFVGSDLFAKDRAAHDRAKQLGEGTPEREEADYVAKRRREDVIDHLRELLRTGKLVAKGRQLRMVKGEVVTDPEDYISNIWGIVIAGMYSVDLDNNSATGGYPQQVFRDVMIGKPD